ncbi:MAG: peptidase domain-containing ABC transporter [Bacteroidota bacterium]
MKKKFISYRQLDWMDCGPTCLRMIAQYYGRYYSLEGIRQKAFTGKEGTALVNLSQAAERLGFRTQAVATDLETLSKDISLPCIAHWRDRHYIVIYRITSQHIYVADPAVGKLKYLKDEFTAGWESENASDGVLLLLETTPEFYRKSDEKADQSFSSWHLLTDFFRPYRKQITQLLVSVFVVGLSQVLFPFLAQALVDEGIRGENLHFIYLILVAQIVLFISQTIAEVIRGYLLLYVGNRVSISLLASFLQKMMQLPHPFFETKNLGDLFQRIADNERIEEFLTARSLTALFSLFAIVVFGAVLAFYHWGIFLIFMAGATLYTLWVLLLARRRAVLEYQRFETSALHQSQLQDVLYGMPEIRLNGSQQRRRQRWEAVRIRQHQVATRTLAVEQWQAQGGRVIHELKNIGMTFLSALLVIQGEMTLGMLIAVQYVIGQLNAPLLNLIGFLQSAQDAKLSLARLSEVFTKPNENNVAHPLLDLTLRGNLSLSNVTFHYEGPHFPAVLSDVSVEIPEGKVTAIVGASGSGKTTLLKLLLKCYEPYKGSIEVGSQPLSQLPTPSWLSRCGVVMQDGYIFDDTVLANITESDSERPLDKQRLAHAVRIAHLEAFVHGLPNSYYTPIGQNGMGLSGGQRQRLLIARAVYKNPDYLFFDEATSALDAKSERFIVSNLETFFQDRTVIIVAHRLSTVKHADQIIVLDQGKVVEQGTHSDLTQQRGEYYHLVKNQLELGV